MPARAGDQFVLGIAIHEPAARAVGTPGDITRSAADVCRLLAPM
jgi:hypothetical protein